MFLALIYEPISTKLPVSSNSSIRFIGKPGAPVLPPFAYVAEVSSKVAEAVAKKAQEQGLAQSQETDMKKAVSELKWYPKY